MAFACACTTLIAAWPGTAWATDPTQADAPVPPLRHESALRHYRALGPATPTSWQQANERVNRIGGWRTYTREAHAPEGASEVAPPSAPTAPATAAPPPASPRKETGHGHH